MPYMTKATHEELVELLPHRWKIQHQDAIMTKLRDEICHTTIYRYIKDYSDYQLQHEAIIAITIAYKCSSSNAYIFLRFSDYYQLSV